MHKKVVPHLLHLQQGRVTISSLPHTTPPFKSPYHGKADIRNKSQKHLYMFTSMLASIQFKIKTLDSIDLFHRLVFHVPSYIKIKVIPFLSGRVPMRRLVYRVQPLPQSMLPLVWDFGQLNTQVEDLYIRQMVRRYVRIVYVLIKKNSFSLVLVKNYCCVCFLYIIIILHL